MIAVPSGHLHIADAFADAGLVVAHVDQHIRDHLVALDPPVSMVPVLANIGGGGRLSHKLEEAVESLGRFGGNRGYRPQVDAGTFRATFTNGNGDIVRVDLWGQVVDRNPELRRMVAVLRGLLPAPDHSRADIVVGVDSDVQRPLLGDGVRCVAIAGQVPAWAVGGELHVIDADLSEADQAAAAVEVCGLLSA